MVLNDQTAQGNSWNVRTFRVAGHYNHWFFNPGVFSDWKYVYTMGKSKTKMKLRGVFDSIVC